MFKQLKLFPILIICTLLTACGGGGSDDNGPGDFVGSANVSLRVSPASIDTGDITRVTVNISEISDNGAILKIRIPNNFIFVPESSVLTFENTEREIEPDTIERNQSQTFLVYFIEQNDFGEDNVGDLTLLLEGRSILGTGVIGVDADANDPDISDDVEFDITNPQFNAEDSVEVEIIG